MFENSLTESSRHTRARKGTRTLLVSVLAHGATLVVLLLLPLIYYQGLSSEQLLTYLQAAPLQLVPAPPAPPTPPAPTAGRRPAQGPQVVQTNAFQEPLEVPQGIPAPPEEVPVPDSLWGQSGSGSGVPAALSGGVPGPVPGAFQPGATGVNAPPPPPPARRREPIRVSDLQNSKLIRRVEPVYPPLAVQVRLEGVVLLQATIDERGIVTNVKVLRGKPLLTQAAVEAVQQWRYSPTVLNGEPVSVITTVTVNFKLNR